MPNNVMLFKINQFRQIFLSIDPGLVLSIYVFHFVIWEFNKSKKRQMKVIILEVSPLMPKGSMVESKLHQSLSNPSQRMTSWNNSSDLPSTEQQESRTLRIYKHKILVSYELSRRSFSKRFSTKV